MSFEELFRGRIKSALFFFPGEPPGEIRDALTSSVKRLSDAFPDILIYSNRSDVLSQWLFARSNPADRHIIRELRKKTTDPIESLLDVFEQSGSGDDDGILFFQGVAPFFDKDLMDEMADLHFRYLASCTVAENLPSGFLPDIISKEFLLNPPDCRGKSLRDCIMGKINEIDVEIFFQLPDLRHIRLDFSCQDYRSLVSTNNLLLKTPDMKYADLQSVIFNDPLLLRNNPSCIELEISSDSPVFPDWFLRKEPGENPHISDRLIDKLIADLNEHALPNDLSVVLGGQGDPMSHPDIIGIVSKFLSHRSVRAVYLETFGIELNEEILKSLSGLQGSEKLAMIIRLSTLNRAKYIRLYGKDYLDTVINNISTIESREPSLPFRVYVEILRIIDVEDEIDDFFKRFEKSKITPLAQKFNSYAGRLMERRVADLTPLNRDFCWHLARDVYVGYDGKIPLCKQDPLCEYTPVYNVVQDGVQGYFEKSAPYFVASYKGDYKSIPAPCEKCDEWYTFNG